MRADASTLTTGTVTQAVCGPSGAEPALPGTAEAALSNSPEAGPQPVAWLSGPAQPAPRPSSARKRLGAVAGCDLQAQPQGADSVAPVSDCIQQLASPAEPDEAPRREYRRRAAQQVMYVRDRRVGPE
jgi:hypothetical protein